LQIVIWMFLEGYDPDISCNRLENFSDPIGAGENDVAIHVL
jgi:hypothetical protein